MKVVDVSGFYSETGGGVRSYVQQKLDEAERAGHRLTIIAPGPQDRVDLRPGGGKIVWVQSPPMPFDANYRLFVKAQPVWQIIDAEAPDVVEGSSPWRGGWIAASWPGAAVKSLVFHQDFVAGYPYTLLGDRLSRPAIDRIFAPYWAYLRRLSTHFDVTVTGGNWLSERLAGFGVNAPHAVPFGIESGRFTPALADEGLRREFLERCGVGVDGKLLLAVGRFHPEKRHSTILEGFALARARRPGLGLVLIGEGPTRSRVEALAARVGNVCLTGAVNDRDHLARIYASADTLVHGSGAETYGLVVAEALASGLPVVVPDWGGSADLAGQGPSVTYATGNAQACASAILCALELPRPLFGEAKVGTAPAHFSALFALYQSLVDQRGGQRL